MALRNKDLISIHDLSVGEVATILDVSRKLKKKQKLGEPHEYLKGKTLAMIFSKASTRTRVSFETGFHQLGGHPIYMSEATSQIGRGEPVKDTARVLSRFVDGIMIRTFSHDAVKELADYATVPVINGLTDLLHPCQALTDMFTILEYKDVLKGRKLVYVGDGNNMAHSLMFAPISWPRPKWMRPAPAAPSPSRKTWKMRPKEPMCSIRMCGPAWVRKPSGKNGKRPSTTTRSTSICWTWPVRTPWCSTACPPTGERKSPMM